MPQTEVAVFGEVLFDHFPDGSRVLGGAPFNVAWHLQAFGLHPRFISRVGDDTDGHEILAGMRGWGMDTGGVQIDPSRPTGQVRVALQDGQPSYDIVHPCAYDAIEVTDPVDCRLLYHGSLALRDDASRGAFRTLRGQSGGQVFLDVNLRSPWWERETLLDWLGQADWVKLNDDELALLGPTGTSDEAAIDALFERDGLEGLFVTYGAEGAVLKTRKHGRVRVRPERVGAVVDTVGAGDAFAAVCIIGILRRWDAPDILERAQAFASAIVGQQGATRADRELYGPFLADWSL